MTRRGAIWGAVGGALAALAAAVGLKRPAPPLRELRLAGPYLPAAEIEALRSHLKAQVGIVPAYDPASAWDRLSQIPLGPQHEVDGWEHRGAVVFLAATYGLRPEINDLAWAAVPSYWLPMGRADQPWTEPGLTGAEMLRRICRATGGMVTLLGSVLHYEPTPFSYADADRVRKLFPYEVHYSAMPGLVPTWRYAADPQKRNVYRISTHGPRGPRKSAAAPSQDQTYAEVVRGWRDRLDAGQGSNMG